MANASRKREYDKRIYKKCIKCRNWKAREDTTVTLSDDSTKELTHGFGKHADSSDGLQSICISCKNGMNAKARERNPTQRIRHHTGTRCLTQLGDMAPESFVADLEKYLGYKIPRLVKHLAAGLKEREGPKRKLRDALAEGYHIDHITPLSSFKVIRKSQTQEDTVDWLAFKACWRMENLRAIPADENLAKGAKHEQAQEPTEEGKEEAKEVKDVFTDLGKT